MTSIETILIFSFNRKKIAFFFTLCRRKISSKNHNMLTGDNLNGTNDSADVYTIKREANKAQSIHNPSNNVWPLPLNMQHSRMNTKHTILKNKFHFTRPLQKKVKKNAFFHQIRSRVTSISENWGIFRDCISQMKTQLFRSSCVIDCGMYHFSCKWNIVSNTANA